VKVRRLRADAEPALEELLERDRVTNLFPLGFLGTNEMSAATWYGVWTGGRVLRSGSEGLLAAALLLPGRLVVPFGDPEACGAIGASLKGRHSPCMLVGPREASDALWKAWAGRTPTRVCYDQRLYACTESPKGEGAPGLRRALDREWEAVAANAARMEEEDLLRNPAAIDHKLHGAVVRGRIQDGRTWVWERDGQLVFQINVGTVTTWGCQVGGTYVPPEWRGQGIARRCMIELMWRLLPVHQMVTLHVNEANAPAVRVYERSGFVAHAPFRLITVR
jgi:GNAT superfamily N-acetyltransferase